jgi:hypothetical protein
LLYRPQDREGLGAIFTDAAKMPGTICDHCSRGASVGHQGIDLLSFIFFV